MANIVPIGGILDPTQMKQYVIHGEEGNKLTGRNKRTYGVFSELPMCSPKYVRHRVGRDHEYEDTLARLLLQIPAGTFYDFRRELDDEVTQVISDVLVSDGMEGGYGYIDFLLTQADHSLNEKVQVSESLADNYTAFFFGSNPPVFSYAGLLMNTFQDDWTMRMLRVFNDLGRGTQLARRGALLHLRYDSFIVSGAMMNFQWSHLGSRETATDFTFNFLVKRMTILYGGLSSPTAVDAISTADPGDITFSPYEIGDLQSIESTQTYAQAPQDTVAPEGVSIAAREQANIIKQPRMVISGWVT